MSSGRGLTGREASVPPERLYWAVLDASSLPRQPFASRALWNRRLGYLFEAVLPVPIESVHAVFVPLGGGTVLACGMERASLREVAEGAISLRPESLPPFVPPTADASSLNLLTREFEPPAIRRARACTTLVTAASLVLCSLLLVVGFANRTRAWNALAFDAERAEHEAYASVLGDATGQSGQPAPLRLVSELRQLRRTRAEPSRESRPTDVAPDLASLLAAWPRDLRARTETLSVTAAGATLTVWLPGQPEAERLIESMRAAEGWSLAQPSLSRSSEGMTVRLQLTRSSTMVEHGAVP